nr:unnamed protein product [Callosobruchus analis]
MIVSFGKVPKIVVCCAVLHNICKHLQDDFELLESGIELPEDPHNLEYDEEVDNIRQRGSKGRQAVVVTMFNNI